MAPITLRLELGTRDDQRTTGNTRGVRLGPLLFPAPLDRLGENLGDGLETVGPAIVAAERRARPFTLKLAVHGEASDGTSKRAVGMRLRRQARQLLENPRWLAHGLLFHFPPDPEITGWLMVGGGELEETDPGITFGEFTLTLSDTYMRGRPGTHRSARRLDLADRRTGLVPRDTRGLLYATDYDDHPLPTRPAILPGDVVHVLAAGGLPAAGGVAGPLFAERYLPSRVLFREYEAVDGEVISFLPDTDRITLDPLPFELERPGMVRVFDQGTDTDPAATTDGELDPALYGWEQVLGPTLSTAPLLVLENGVCRLVSLPADGGVALEAWDAAARAYVRQGAALPGDPDTIGPVREITVLEVTPERAVLEWRYDAASLRAILQRGWPGPRLEAHDPAGAAALYVQSADADGTGAAGDHASVTVLDGGGYRIAGSQSHEAVAYTSADPWGNWSTAGEVLAVQVALGPDATATDDELTSLGLADARSTPVLLARGL